MSRWCGYLARFLAVAILLGCAARPALYTSNPVELQKAAELRRQVDELRNDPVRARKMVEKMMGKSPPPDQPSSDGIRVVIQAGHASAINSVALSPDGHYILSAGQDEAVRLWDVASGQEVRTFPGVDAFEKVRFSGDGGRAIITGSGNSKILDTLTGQQLQETAGIISDDGRYVVQDSPRKVSGLRRRIGGSVGVFDSQSGQVVWNSTADGIMRPVALSADGRTLLLAALKSSSANVIDQQWSLQVWDLVGKRLRRTIDARPGMAPGLLSAVISPDGQRVVVENGDRTLGLYDLDGGAEPRSLGLPSSNPMAEVLNSIVFSTDSTLIAAARANSTGSQISVWEVSSGRQLAQLAGSAVNFSVDGRTLVIGRSEGGAPFLKDVTSGKETSVSAGASAILDITAVGSGHMVAAATQDGAIRLWNLSTAEFVRALACPGHVAASSVAADADAHWLAAGCMDGSAWLWDLGSGSEAPLPIVTPLAAQFAKTLVRFSPDGQWIAVGVKEKLIVWDVAAGREIHSINLPDSPVPPMLAAAGAVFDVQSIQALAIRNDSHLIAVGRLFETSLWDPAAGQRVGLLSDFDGSSQKATAQADNGRQARLGALLPGTVFSRSGSTPVTEAGDASKKSLPPGDTLDEDESGLGDSVQALSFSADGGTLIVLTMDGRQRWDLGTGRKIRPARDGQRDSPDFESQFAQLIGEEMSGSAVLAISPDGRFAARGVGRVIKVWDIASDRDDTQLVGHTSDVASLTYLEKGRLLVSGGRDGTLRLWHMPQGTELAQLIALGESDYIAVTPDQYYRASRSRIKGVAFRVNDRLYPFEQFDLRFNRPDIVLERLGSASAETISSYRTAYEHRLKKMGFTASMLGGDFHLPEIGLVGKPAPVSTNATSLTLSVRSTDDKYPLDRINVFVNDVPVFGTAGLPIADRGSHEDQREIKVPLVYGRNKIQISVLNQQASESLRQTAYITSTADQGPSDIYLVAIGVSEYQNRKYNLRYAAKDARDLAQAYRAPSDRSGARGQVHVLDLTDSKATRAGIQQAKDWLKQARANDLVVVFAAGHGMTDERQNYYFGTYDIDAGNPQVNGLPYEEFEALLDGIASLQKLLLIDTCFSGEIEQNEPAVVAHTQTDGAGTVNMRSFKAARGVQIVAGAPGGPPSLSTDVLRFQQDLFADLRRGTGAVVISSASGSEFALEGEQWRNGVFTYALLSGLKEGKADANKDGTVTVGELQTYVINEVRKLTAGGQNPTVRRENLDYDFPVY